jgi:hypothetical protein
MKYFKNKKNNKTLAAGVRAYGSTFLLIVTRHRCLGDFFWPIEAHTTSRPGGNMKR